MSTTKINLSGIHEIDITSPVNSASASQGVLTVDLGASGSGDATSIRGVNIASALATPSDGDLLAYSAALGDWEVQNFKTTRGWRCGGTATPSVTQYGTSLTTSANSVSVVVNSTYGNGLRLASAVSTGTAAILNNNQTPGDFCAATVRRFRICAKIESVVGERVFFCLSDIGNATIFGSDDPTTTHTIGFKYCTATDTAWKAYTSDGSGSSIQNTGIEPDANPHTYEFVVSGTTIYFLIDGMLVATNVNTHIPASTTQMRFTAQCEVRDGTQKFLTVYWFTVDEPP